METRKFEYLESIRETIEHGEYDDLNDYVEDIREEIVNDPEFTELLKEVRSKNYKDVMDRIDEIMYKDLQVEVNELFENAEIEDLEAGENYILDLDIEDAPPEGIIPEDDSYEQFNDEEFLDSLENDF